MMKVIKASACYTGGGIYEYMGVLDDGRHYLTWTDWEDYILFLDVNPWDEEFEDDYGYTEWQDEHKAGELFGDEALKLSADTIKWILKNHPTDGWNNYSTSELEHALDVLLD